MLRELEEMRRALQGRIEGSAHLGLLEELIPLEEAMGLAKDGKGKGYFQLALRYAGGNELPRDSKLAYKMLCKARDADYANAVLVEGLCDEADLQTPSGYSGRASVGSAMREYCGVKFVNGRRDSDSLTNEVAFARVMGKYEKAKSLGALTATNQIAALNKRLAGFNAERPEVEAEQANARAEAELAEECNRKILEMMKAEDAKARKTWTKRQRAEYDVRSLREACVAYYIQQKKLPTALDQLTECETRSLAEKLNFWDPWGNQYALERIGRRIVVLSCGEDGVKGTGDDIRSDSRRQDGY